MTAPAGTTPKRPVSEQARRVAREVAASVAVELIVVGLVRRHRRAHDRPRQHRGSRLLHAVLAEAASESVESIAERRRRLLYEFERRINAGAAAARQH